MRVRLTVVAEYGRAVDVRIVVPRGTRLEAVLPELTAAIGGTVGRALGEQVIGVPPLVEGAIIGVGPALQAPSGPALRVVGGPDAGRVLATDATPGTCADEVTLLWSPDGRVRRIRQLPAVLALGTTIRCGTSLVSYEVASEVPLATEPDGAGGMRVHRPPRFVPRAVPTEVTFPDATPAGRTPWALIIGPGLLGAAYWGLAGGDPGYLALTVLGPLLYSANAIGERFTGRRKRKQWAVEVAAARDALYAGLAAESTTRRAAAPDPAAVRLTAMLPGARLWERRPGDADALLVRVGSAPLPASLPVLGSDPDGDARRTLAPVPVTLSLAELGVVGLAGPAEIRRNLARWLVIQVAVHHPPSEVRLAILCAGSPAPWRWARWLPHLERSTLLTGLTATLDARLAAPEATTAPRLRYVLVLDDAVILRSQEGVRRLLDAGPAAGFVAICLCAEPLMLPAECRATVASGAAPGYVVVRNGPSAPVTALVDGVSPAWAEEVARALAPLREADASVGTSSAALPASVRLRDLLGLAEPDTAGADVAERWRRSPRSTRVPLGVDARGTVWVDLVADGPHALVAGTTGAGKSELLQTLVAGLAVGNRPEELAFLLIDYKGGAAFGAAVELPHTVGLVTDLDPRLTARALASLGAELRRRERLLARSGAKGLESYQAQGSLPAVGRLVIVVDEFATLAAELPSFVTGLVDVARRGRSLGVHLVLATQRPAGVVSAEMRANTALRICLRVTDAADSADVLDAPDAARIPPHCPGRGFVRNGGRLTAVQIAGVSARPQIRRAQVAVTVLSADEPPAEAEPSRNEESDLVALVSTVRAAAKQVGAAAPPRPWLPPLPELVRLDALPAGAPDQLTIGLADEPSAQRQVPYAIDLAAGRSLGILGGSRSGRTSAVRTIAARIARTEPDDVHLYVLDGGGKLSDLASMPHCAAVVGSDDTARAARLRAVLGAELRHRSALLAAAGLASVTEQRRSAPPARRLPWLVLLVDGHEGITAALDEPAAEQYLVELQGLLRDGPAAGLTIVLTGGPALAAPRLGSMLADRLVLRQDHPDGYITAGVHHGRAGIVAGPLPPGRAVLADADQTEIQIALPGTSVSLPRRHRAAAGPARLRPLPLHVSLTECGGTNAGAPLRVMVGLGGDAAEPCWLDLASDGPGVLVAGPPGSGRSNALKTLALGLAAQGTAVALVAPRR